MIEMIPVSDSDGSERGGGRCPSVLPSGGEDSGKEEATTNTNTNTNTNTTTTTTRRTSMREGGASRRSRPDLHSTPLGNPAAKPNLDMGTVAQG